MQALSDMLKTNAVLKELDMSSNHMDSADARMLSEGIAANRAMTKLNISNNHVSEEVLHLITELCNTKGIKLLR